MRINVWKLWKKLLLSKNLVFALKLQNYYMWNIKWEPTLCLPRLHPVTFATIYLAIKDGFLNYSIILG